MLKYARFLVPYLIRGPHRNPAKKLAGVAIFCLLILLSAIFFATALFIWLAKMFGTEIAFATLGAVFMIGAITALFMGNRSTKDMNEMPSTLASDPLVKYIPDAIQKNPTTQKLLYQIGENPVTATVTAVTVGMLLYRELLEDI